MNRFLLTKITRLTSFILVISLGSTLFSFKAAEAQSRPLTPASTKSSSTQPMLMVRLDDIGQIYVEQTPVTREQLIQAIINFNIAEPCGLVVVSASRVAMYDSVIKVIDILRAAAAQRIALAFPLDEEDGMLNPSTPIIVEMKQLSPPTSKSLCSLTPKG